MNFRIIAAYLIKYYTSICRCCSDVFVVVNVCGFQFQTSYAFVAFLVQ